MGKSAKRAMRAARIAALDARPPAPPNPAMEAFGRQLDLARSFFIDCPSDRESLCREFLAARDTPVTWKECCDRYGVDFSRKAAVIVMRTSLELNLSAEELR